MAHLLKLVRIPLLVTMILDLVIVNLIRLEITVITRRIAGRRSPLVHARNTDEHIMGYRVAEMDSCGLLPLRSLSVTAASQKQVQKNKLAADRLTVGDKNLGLCALLSSFPSCYDCMKYWLKYVLC